jgi:tRNA A-37 threonylcarbamoyl transferase component Bud32
MSQVPQSPSLMSPHETITPRVIPQPPQCSEPQNPAISVTDSLNLAAGSTQFQRKTLHLSTTPQTDTVDGECLTSPSAKQQLSQGGSAQLQPLEEIIRQRRRSSSVRTSNLCLSQHHEPDEFDIASEARTPRCGGVSPRPLFLDHNTPREEFDYVDTLEKADEAAETTVEFVSMLPPLNESSQYQDLLTSITSVNNAAKCGCGSKLVPNAKFCHECGVPVSQPPSLPLSGGQQFICCANKQSFSGDPLLWSMVTAGQGNNDSAAETPGNNSFTLDPLAPQRQQRRSSVKVYHRQVKIASGEKSLLGRGAKGSTYKAMDVATGKPLAVKEMRLDFTDEVEVRNIRSELRHLSTIRHPHVVEYLGCMIDAENQIVRILMERLECGTLEDLLRQFQSGIPEEAIRTFTAQLLMAVMHCHELGTTHRDIKPANILQSASGTIKLADFGCALLASKNHVQDDFSVAGTAAYMPPEALEVANHRGSTFEHAVAHDIWSIGCTVHELLTGAKPWEHLGLEPIPLLWKMKSLGPFPISENISEIAKDFLQQCLQQNMGTRPTARQLLAHPFVSLVSSPV